jgi:uncharacterized protein YdaU (DUF1376 family)
MPLFIADYLADTSHLRANQSGGYLHLIMHYWQNGALPSDDVQLAAIARMTPAEWKREKPVLRAFFYEGWRHKRVETELRKIAKKNKIFSKRGKEAANARWGKDECNKHATSMHEAMHGACIDDAKAMHKPCIPDATSDFTGRKDPIQGKVTPFREVVGEGQARRRNGGAA